jgi:hypothetical protein
VTERLEQGASTDQGESEKRIQISASKMKARMGLNPRRQVKGGSVPAWKSNEANKIVCTSHMHEARVNERKKIQNG